MHPTGGLNEMVAVLPRGRVREAVLDAERDQRLAGTGEPGVALHRTEVGRFVPCGLERSERQLAPRDEVLDVVRHTRRRARDRVWHREHQPASQRRRDHRHRKSSQQARRAAHVGVRRTLVTQWVTQAVGQARSLSTSTAFAGFLSGPAWIRTRDQRIMSLPLSREQPRHSEIFPY